MTANEVRESLRNSSKVKATDCSISTYGYQG